MPAADEGKPESVFSGGRAEGCAESGIRPPAGTAFGYRHFQCCLIAMRIAQHPATLIEHDILKAAAKPPANKISDEDRAETKKRSPSLMLNDYERMDNLISGK